jgi:hypothetical protein
LKKKADKYTLLVHCHTLNFFLVRPFFVTIV